MLHALRLQCLKPYRAIVSQPSRIIHDDADVQNENLLVGCNFNMFKTLTVLMIYSCNKDLLRKRKR